MSLGFSSLFPPFISLSLTMICLIAMPARQITPQSLCHSFNKYLLSIIYRLCAMWVTWVWSLGGEDPLEKGMVTHSSILAWRIPWTEEPGGLHTVHGVAESDRTEQLTFHFSLLYRLGIELGIADTRNKIKVSSLMQLNSDSSFLDNRSTFLTFWTNTPVSLGPTLQISRRSIHVAHLHLKLIILSLNTISWLEWGYNFSAKLSSSKTFTFPFFSSHSKLTVISKFWKKVSPFISFSKVTSIQIFSPPGLGHSEKLLTDFPVSFPSYFQHILYPVARVIFLKSASSYNFHLHSLFEHIQTSL